MKSKNLKTKVMNFFPHKDKDGKFISYCSYEKHRGIVLRPRICEGRDCNHYHKMYVDPRECHGNQDS